MHSSEVLYPRIIKQVWPSAMAAAACSEAMEAAQFIANPENKERIDPYGATHNLFHLQGGFNLLGFTQVSIITAIVKLMEDVVKYPCIRGKSSVRFQSPKPEWPALPWHQDYAGMGIKERTDAIVAWVPLNAIDGTRPTIEFCKTQDGIGREHTRDPHHFLAADNQELKGEPVIGLEPGDVVLFSPMTLHRTYWRPDMAKGRSSMDLRFYEDFDEGLAGA